ncbi:hypothetical protein SAMN04489867_2782 [Pedococcus dokdonensis]|uniref:Uncharacterized protein n=1 Tax=Pedococcus dokdonensis TaxID=443156 RepID=A0A1H0TEW4_9MICO|nr:hypothetical protein [Pedococcus dokdonensis]SDP52559.1 hypothetical protein SAMN04489867_2782 [Pedococcus dokdonensis]
MTCTSTTPVVDASWADAVALADRLQRGERPADLGLGGLPADERATLQTSASYEQQCAPREDHWGEPSATQVVVTDRRILVSHQHRGLLSLWYVDVENLQLARAEDGWALDLHPVGINPHVRITGPTAPLVAVHVAHAAFPRTWQRLSGLLPLLEAA